MSVRKSSKRGRDFRETLKMGYFLKFWGNGRIDFDTVVDEDWNKPSLPVHHAEARLSVKSTRDEDGRALPLHHGSHALCHHRAPQQQHQRRPSAVVPLHRLVRHDQPSAQHRFLREADRRQV